MGITSKMALKAIWPMIMKVAFTDKEARANINKATHNGDLVYDFFIEMSEVNPEDRGKVIANKAFLFFHQKSKQWKKADIKRISVMVSEVMNSLGTFLKEPNYTLAVSTIQGVQIIQVLKPIQASPTHIHFEIKKSIPLMELCFLIAKSIRTSENRSECYEKVLHKLFPSTVQCEEAEAVEVTDEPKPRANDQTTSA